MESSSVILDTRISFFIGKSHPEREVSVREVLRTIGDETYARRINELRSLLEIGDNDKYKEQKKFLPAVTFSGIFKEKRAVETCKCYTHLMVFDIDHCPSNKMNVMAETLRNDMHVIAFWISPSGEGYKGLIRLEYGEEWTYTDDSEKHKMGTGVGTEQIHKNLRWACEQGLNVLPRIPVIPGFNAELSDAEGIAKLLHDIGLHRVQLLPFHQMGERKYEFLNRDYEMTGVKALHPEDLTEYQKVFLDQGIDCFF